MSDKRKQETRRMAEAAESEIDREFETASLAMMRAFEAFQRYEAGLEDVGVEDVTAVSRWLESKHDVAVSMHMILRAIGVSPTGPMAARVVRKKLDECDLERCVIDRVAHPPTREAVIAGLTALAEERYRQMDGFFKEHIGNETATHNLEMDPGGIGAAFRSVRRERDAFILARDHA